jgi:hypothetical protein
MWFVTLSIFVIYFVVKRFQTKPKKDNFLFESQSLLCLTFFSPILYKITVPIKQGSKQNLWELGSHLRMNTDLSSCLVSRALCDFSSLQNEKHTRGSCLRTWFSVFIQQNTNFSIICSTQLERPAGLSGSLIVEEPRFPSSALACRDLRCDKTHRR